MKKIKVKQKQKQSQTVNINLGNMLKKKSKPRRKPQPKQPSSLAAPITFNVPPIREYVDTSLYNIPSRLENPLLVRQTVNPIPDIPITNKIGPIQSNNPLFQEKQKEIKITDEPINDKPIFLEELSQYIPQFNLNKKNNEPNDYEIELQKKLIEIQKQNSIKKKADAALLLKEENKKIKQEKALQKKTEKALQKKEDILNYVTKPSVSIKKDIQTYSVKPEETQPIFLAPEQQKTLFSAPEEQETITSLLEQAMLNQTETPPPMTEEELAFSRLLTKAPTKKRPPTEEGKKIVARPIKIDPNTGEPIKKEKKAKLEPNIGKTVIVQPPV